MVQYFNWLGGLFHGDLGTSIYYHEDVAHLLLKRFPITLHLGLSSFVISNLLGILLGLFAGISARPG
jgi:peptide/nickel transport system permease protein